MKSSASFQLFLGIFFAVSMVYCQANQRPKSLVRGQREGHGIFSEHPFSKLNVIPIFAQAVQTYKQCLRDCAANPNCWSVNFGRKEVLKGVFLCELLPKDRYNSSASFVSPEEDFFHYSIKTPCLTFPCQNNGICVPNYFEDTYKCKCTSGVTDQYCEWLKIGSAVCIGARDDQFGRFTIPFACHVLNFKLVYVSGGGIAWRLNEGKAYWGRAKGNSNSALDLHITDTSNNRISPPLNFPLISTKYGLLRYELPGVTNMDPELTLPELSPPLAVTACQEFRIWVDQDLNDYSESDNSGQTCADVWIKKY